MALKPWYKVVTPREDLREGKPLDASEFAVHLDQIRDEQAPKTYQDPELFFASTYLTKNLSDLAVDVLRRLSGLQTETSAVFNMATQFGGGKTHALTLLYHLAKTGKTAMEFAGVKDLLEKAGLSEVPAAQTAVFVGTEFDHVVGRGGEDGTPLRKTPWGEIAFQLGGAEGFSIVAEHDQQMTSPAGDVVRRILPADKPSLILIDELMHYVSRTRKSGGSAQLYNFIHSLSEVARNEKGVVLCIAVPKSVTTEMNAEDEAEYTKLKHLLNRLGKSVVMTAETESSEIIRRRLFEWDTTAVNQSGKIMIGRDAIQTCNEYADWVTEQHHQLAPFDVPNARRIFADCYPFHPTVLSVFERKWQALPSFQRTRGILRLLALWVSHAYRQGFEGAHKDALITLGTAPLEDSLFQRAVFEQLGEQRLDVAVATDICGRPDSHAVRLDAESNDAIRKARLHRKTASAIFFESNGGQARHEATVPEIRLAVGEPDLDIGNVETALHGLESSNYYLNIDHNKYSYGITQNLNKVYSDRRANVTAQEIAARVKEEVIEVFKKKNGVEQVPFPEKSGQIADRPVLTFVIVSPERSIQDAATKQYIETMTREAGTSARTYKSALIWCVPDNPSALFEEARRLLAWELIKNEEGRLDESQKGQLAENLSRARRDLKESVWRTYKNVVLLSKDNTLRTIDFGLLTSSASDSLPGFILKRLQMDGDLTDSVSPNFLNRNWSPVYEAWSTKAVRDAFFASPQFPRLLAGDVLKQTIANGVSGGQFAYVSKSGDRYDPFIFDTSLAVSDVEFADDVYILKKEAAEKYREAKSKPAEQQTPPESTQPDHDMPVSGGTLFGDQETQEPSVSTSTPTVSRIGWSGEVPSHKWSTFYQKVLMKYHGPGLTVSVRFEAAPEDGISTQKVEETKSSLRELGLSDDISIE